MAAVEGAEQELVGYSRHGFRTMQELQNSLILAYEAKRWLDNEEKVAMILNPQPFIWNLEAFNDRDIYRDCYFFLISEHLFNAVGNLSNVLADRWLGYARDELRRQEMEVGGKKNLKYNRRVLDREEITLICKEVKGQTHQRRRSCLPHDFAVRAGPDIPEPVPALMVLEYQRVPFTPRALRVQRAQEEEELDIFKALNGVRQLQPGPPRPPGILPQAPPPDAPIGPRGRGGGRGGRGGDRGRGGGRRGRGREGRGRARGRRGRGRGGGGGRGDVAESDDDDGGEEAEAGHGRGRGRGRGRGHGRGGDDLEEELDVNGAGGGNGAAGRGRGRGGGRAGRGHGRGGGQAGRAVGKEEIIWRKNRITMVPV